MGPRMGRYMDRLLDRVAALDISANLDTVHSNGGLGKLDQTALLDGRLAIDAAAARRAIKEKIAAPLGITADEAALGILRIAIANMNRAIHAVSTEKGHDIREFALIAYGGAGRNVR